MHNAVASLLHTALLIILGYYFHKKIVTTIAGVEIFKNVLLFSSAVIVGFIISLAAKKTDKKSSQWEGCVAGVRAIIIVVIGLAVGTVVIVLNYRYQILGRLKVFFDFNEIFIKLRVTSYFGGSIGKFCEKIVNILDPIYAYK